jgi:hypothetical protein
LHILHTNVIDTNGTTYLPVMAARPARHPFIKLDNLNIASPVFLSCAIKFAKRETIPAAAPAKVVLTTDLAMTAGRISDPNSMAEPALKPYQPNHNIKVPNICNDLLCPGKGFGCGNLFPR